MRWEDERYVRLYTRDTASWMALGWEAQALFMLILRKVDRVGVLDLGRTGERGLASLVAMPLEVVERSLRILLDDGCIERVGTSLIIKNYLEAQEASMSPAMRQKESRLRQRDLIRSGLDPNQRETVIYFIQSEHGGPIKIGMADDVAKRIVSLQTSRPDKLVLLGAFRGAVADERATHERFANLREKGEWFSATDELMAFIREKCAGRDQATACIVTNRDDEQNDPRHETRAVTLNRTVPSRTVHDLKKETPILATAPAHSRFSLGSDPQASPTGTPPAPPAEESLPRSAQEQDQEQPGKVTVSTGPVATGQSAPRANGGQADLLGAAGTTTATAPKYDPATDVFEHYTAGWHRHVRGTRPPKLDDKRRKLVLARIKEGWLVSELKLACDGLWRSVWHVDNRQTSFELVMRDTAHVEQFLSKLPSVVQPVVVVPPKPDPEIAAMAMEIGSVEDASRLLRGLVCTIGTCEEQ